MLTKGGVEFAEIDLSTDAVAMERIKELGYSQAPVVEAGNQHWSGFRMEKLQQIISQAKADINK